MHKSARTGCSGLWRTYPDVLKMAKPDCLSTYDMHAMSMARLWQKHFFHVWASQLGYYP